MKTMVRNEIAPSAARRIVDEALAFAEREGWEVAVAVVDPSGHLVSFGRTDNVSPAIGEFALDKAYTAGLLRKSSKSFGERMLTSDGLSLGVSTRSRLLPWGGGVAIFSGTDCVGGVGVSGAQEHEDIACAEAALQALELTSG